MFVTVAVCTWNRSKLLDQALTRMAELHVPAGVDWELLVVNNNSPDDTAAVVARHADAGRLPIRALFEPKQGLSHARNCAVAAARGDLMVWTDDDVLVPTDWLAGYAVAARQFPAAAYFGGPIRPWFPSRPPRWASRNLDLLGAYWALLDIGAETRPLAANEEVYGANMAYRTEVLRGYRFDPNAGHNGNALSGGEETKLQAQLRANGHRGTWVATAPVLHYVPAERMSAGYLWKLHRAYGRLYYPAADYAAHPKLGAVPRWILRRYLTERTKLAVFGFTRSRRWVKALLAAGGLRGMIDAARAHAAAALGTAGTEPLVPFPCGPKGA